MTYKRPFSPRRVLRGAVCFSLAAALCTGCSSLLPAASPTITRSEAAASLPYDSTRLEDGRLRILYDPAGGSTVLRGSEVVYTASADESVALLPDTLTQQVQFFFHSWADNSGENRRRSALCDSSGRTLIEFNGEYSATLTGDVLVLQQPVFEDGEFWGEAFYGNCRVIDLSTGSDLPVPEDAYDCLVQGDTLIFNCYALPAGLSSMDYDPDQTSHLRVEMRSRSGELLHTVPCCYTLSGNGTPENWVELCQYNNGDFPAYSLYNTVTGEELSNFHQSLGNGIVCYGDPQNGGALLVDLSGSEKQVLGSFDQTIDCYVPGYAMSYDFTSNSPFHCILHDLSTGEDLVLYDYHQADGEAAFYTANGQLLVFDSATGEKITDVMVEPVPGQQYASIFCIGNGQVSVELKDNDDYETTACRVYGPDGLVGDLTAACRRFDYFSPLTRTPEGEALFSGSYSGVGGSYLTDVVDSQGNVVIQGLRSVYGYAANSINGLPQGVFAAQQGFYNGWMDSDGSWVYCQSIFTLADDEGGTYYYE